VVNTKQLKKATQGNIGWHNEKHSTRITLDPKRTQFWVSSGLYVT
jgi:hypothetical protein